MISEAETYVARRLAGTSKWAVFRGDEQTTRGGSEKAAQSWANFMNRGILEEKG